MVSRQQDLAEQSEQQLYETALRWLSRRDYAEQELRRRLLSRGAAAEAVEAVLSRLRDSRYVDDERFAAGRVRHRRDYSRRGRSAVRQELRELGVDSDVAEQALESELSEQQERELLRGLVARAAAGLELIDDPLALRRRVQSLQRRLLSRGFRPAAVFEAVQDQLAELFDAEN